MNSNSKGKHKKEESKSCLFCLSDERNKLKFGKIYKYKSIYVHYYCLLLSSGVKQRGKDKDGILGFLEKDILKEQKRGEKLICKYCQKSGATIGCSLKTCKVWFHFPCGLQNNALNQFFGSFDSFCVNHRIRQTLDTNLEVNEKCLTCFEKLDFDEGIKVLVTPCCHKLFHRLCLQQQALSAGSYHFKCPHCNDINNFVQQMNEFGLCIPKRDASWERDNAFGDLYQRYSNCDQEKCLCPNGRQFTDESNWQMLICYSCGSKGTHCKCFGSVYVEVWVCTDCQTLEKEKLNDSSSALKETNFDNSDSDLEIVSVVKSNQLKHSFETISDRKSKKTKLEPKVMKDMAIQCELVTKNELIDCDPIDDLKPHVFKNSFINLCNDFKEKKKIIGDIIDIEDSDDDCIPLN